jgi:hypothetical protein
LPLFAAADLAAPSPADFLLPLVAALPPLLLSSPKTRSQPLTNFFEAPVCTVYPVIADILN